MMTRVNESERARTQRAHQASLLSVATVMGRLKAHHLPVLRPLLWLATIAAEHGHTRAALRGSGGLARLDVGGEHDLLFWGDDGRL